MSAFDRAALAAVMMGAAVLLGPGVPSRAAEPAVPGATGAAAPGEIVPGGREVEGDAALGEYLSGECVTCHQISGNYDGIPSIVGWPAYWFVQAMEEYKSRKRANPIMQTIAGRFSEEEIAALAVYFERVMKEPPH